MKVVFLNVKGKVLTINSELPEDDAFGTIFDYVGVVSYNLNLKQHVLVVVKAKLIGKAYPATCKFVDNYLPLKIVRKEENV